MGNGILETGKGVTSKNEHAPGSFHECACVGGMEIILERWDQSINWNLE